MKMEKEGEDIKNKGKLTVIFIQFQRRDSRRKMEIIIIIIIYTILLYMNLCLHHTVDNKTKIIINSY